uniref:VWFA domain-containing protein n=1 Tax=Ciona savignyi TaxID=51511 RepID=H2YY69_CIOSA
MEMCSVRMVIWLGRNAHSRAMKQRVIVLDSSSSFGKKNWDMMKAFVRNILNSFEISSIAARAAIFRYNSKVYTDSQILLGDFPDNKTALLAAYDAIIHNGRGTKTGQALLHVNNTILNEVGGNRPEAQDVVITITDGRSEDDVAVVSGSLRSRGALTYAIGVMPPNSKGVDEQQMLSVAGQPSNIFIARNDFEGVYEKLIKKLDLDICVNV